MKKIFFTLIATIAFISFTSAISAQKADNMFSRKAIDPEKIIASEIRLNDVNIRAVRDFIKSYQNISNAKWYSIKDGFIVKFVKDSVETKVEYDVKGNRRFVLNTYNEYHLPFGVRDIVKRQYYDYAILVAYEINHDNGVVYIIKIEDKSRLKTLRIADGEMVIIGDYIKG